MQRGLKILQGPKDIGKVIGIGSGKIICGRKEDSQIRLEGEKVSKKHCEFFCEQDYFRVKDLASSNGTYVNGERVTEMRLRKGDRIQIGEYIMEVVIVGES